MRKGIFAAAVLLLSLGFCSRPLLAQQLLWDVDFKFGFDNREYASIDTEPSGTIFGAVLSPKVGLGFGPCMQEWMRPNISEGRHLN